MLNEHTLDQLRGLRLDGMVHALSDQASSAAAAQLAFDERLAMLVQREIDWRDGKRLARLLKAAKLKVGSACIEDIDWRGSRGLDRSLVTALAGGNWLRHGHNVLITGATGVGKTWLACALAQQAARSGFTVLYMRAPRLLEELRVAHGDGSFGRRLAQLARIDLLAIDDSEKERQRREGLLQIDRGTERLAALRFSRVTFPEVGKVNQIQRLELPVREQPGCRARADCTPSRNWRGG